VTAPACTQSQIRVFSDRRPFLLPPLCLLPHSASLDLLYLQPMFRPPYQATLSFSHPLRHSETPSSIFRDISRHSRINPECSLTLLDLPRPFDPRHSRIYCFSTGSVCFMSQLIL
jgi:hypothetical protein